MERWLPIPGHPKYLVSDKGQVKGQRGHILVLTKRPTGYYTVGLYDHCKQACRFVHRLVLLAFAGPCPNGHECCHINGDPGDNRLENLMYGTARENAAQRRAHGRQVMGEAQGQARLTAEAVAEIRAAKAAAKHREWGQVEAARKYGVCVSTIAYVVAGKSWKHVK